MSKDPTENEIGLMTRKLFRCDNATHEIDDAHWFAKAEHHCSSRGKWGANMRPLARLAFVVTATFIISLTTVQKSDAALFEQISPTAITYSFGFGLDFASFSGTAAGEVTSTVFYVGGTGLGCAASDFAGFSSGSIAIMERGICTFREKLEFAKAAGAVAGLIYQDALHPDPGAFFGTTVTPIDFLAASLSRAVGLSFQNGNTVHLVMTADDVRLNDVPVPAVGAGLPGLLLAGSGLLVWWRRKKKAGPLAV